MLPTALIALKPIAQQIFAQVLDNCFFRSKMERIVVDRLAIHRFAVVVWRLAGLAFILTSEVVLQDLWIALVLMGWRSGEQSVCLQLVWWYSSVALATTRLTLLPVLALLTAVGLFRLFLGLLEIVLWIMFLLVILLLFNAQLLLSVKHVVQPALTEYADIVWVVIIFQAGYALLVP
jgi:hypothetical protein